MKYHSLLIPIAVLSLSLCSPKQQHETPSSDSLSTLAHDSIHTVVKSHSPWIIPLEVPLSNSRLILVLASHDNKVPLYNQPGATKPDDFLTDTTQTLMLATSGYPDPCGEDVFYYQIVIKKSNAKKWIISKDFLAVDQLSLGTFTTPNGILQLGSMKPFTKDSDCASIRTLFLHDDKAIYLIDIGKSVVDDVNHWGNDRHLSLVGAPPGIGISGGTQENIFVATWGLPNGKATLKLSFADGHVKLDEYNIEAVEGDFEGSAEDTPSFEEVKIETVECTFVEYSMGDCGHTEFSCGDFGNAITDKLPAEDGTLWSSLFQNSPDDSGNPDLKGKTFTISYRMVQGDKCGNPSAPQYGDVQELISFKLTLVN